MAAFSISHYVPDRLGRGTPAAIRLASFNGFRPAELQHLLSTDAACLVVWLGRYCHQWEILRIRDVLGDFIGIPEPGTERQQSPCL